MPEVTRELLLKIARIAGDERGDPATRAIAWAKLEAFNKTHPHLFTVEEPPPPPPLLDEPSTQPPPPDEVHWFLDLTKWKTTANGNLTRIVWHGKTGAKIRVVIFRYKRTPEYGWIRFIGDDDDNKLFCIKRSNTQEEAMEDAWSEIGKS